MIKLSETTQYGIISLLVFLAGAAVAVASYYYVGSEGSELEQKMEVVGKSNLMQERYNTLFESLEAHQDEHMKLAGYMLTENETINFLNEIETIARSMGLTYNTDSLSVGPLSNPQFEAITLKVRASGERVLLMEFLKLLETLPYFSRITELELTTSGAETGAWSASVTLMVGLTSTDTI